MRQGSDARATGGSAPERGWSLLPQGVLFLLAIVSLGATIVVDDDGSTPDLATALASAQAGDTWAWTAAQP